MSWMKRPQPGEGAGAGPQPYAAPQTQPFPNQQTMYQNYPASTGNVAQQPAQQGQYWHAPSAAPAPQQFNQQYGGVYQQEYAPNANQVYQQPQYNHNYTNSGYTNPQQGYQQHYYPNQPPQNYPQNQTANNDGWEDNWDWGWDESAKQAQRAQKAQHAAQHQHEHAFNNANVLEESFAPTNTWNWAMDDKKPAKEPNSLPPELVTEEPATLPTSSVQNNISPEPNNVHSVNNGAPILPQEEVRTLSDRDVVKERMPNLALGKRFHLDNLTPQWSIESQMSQESSDGPQTHSESTYRSDNQSRNSNSPGPNTDNSNFNYSQSGLDEGYTQNSEWSRQSDEPTLADGIQTGSRRESHEELVHTMHDLTLVNHENPSSENLQVSPATESRSAEQSLAGAQLPPAASPALPPPAGAPHLPLPSMSMPPPPPVSVPAPTPPAVSPTRPPSAGQVSTPPLRNAPQPNPASVASLPPPNFPPPSNSQNPFKHAGPFAHKPKASSSATSTSAPGQPFPQPMSGSNLSSPAAVGKALAGRPPPPPVGFEANLETTPDNSERPDAPAPPGAWSPLPPPAHHVPDNMEVAPQNDRNEYLQTAHLSSGDYGENTDFTRDAPPPPGLRRMVVGRHEPAPERDEPPPGLARMVPGRQTEGDGACDRPGDPYRDRPAAYRRADGGRTPEYGGERRPVRTTPAGEPSAPPEYAQYTRPALAGLERDPPALQDNLQDLSAVSSADLGYSRDDTLEARSATPERAPPEPGRRSSADTDRDRPYDASPRRGSRDRDGDGRHSRPDRKHNRDDGKPARDERRSERERRERREGRERGDSPDARHKRRPARSHRYETEDTDYYSDKERERRRHREGSYASRPPRPDESRRYDERGARARRHAGADGRERPERSYREIDPTRKYGNRRREREEEERRRVTFSRDAKPSDSSRSEGEPYSSPSRAESREATATDEEPERRRERRARHSTRRTVDPYYDGYGGGAYGDPYLAQRVQYEYYERLRASDPAAYMQLYKRLMAGQHDPLEGYAGAGGAAYGAREERGSVHSGRSSATGLKGNDTYYAFRHDSLRDAPSLRADLSDRDLTTDVSLPANLEGSTARSDRMTPHRFSTAHVKGSIGSRHVVVVRPSWPVDGFPATVQLLSLPHVLQHDPLAAELHNCPGPLVKGVTHKKSVIEYCMVRVRSAAREATRDVGGYGLLWELLALLLRQNGVVVGSDIAELLMKNTREHEYKTSTNTSAHNESRRGSALSASADERASPDRAPPAPAAPAAPAANESSPASVDETAALDKLREYLLYGNRQEALEWAMSCNLWGHALHLAAFGDRRTRAGVAARFLGATPRADPLHTLYAALGGARPPAAACLADARWADWRPHAAILLANAGARPDHDTRTLTALGDSLASRGLPYSAQFCYVVGGVQFARHPLAPLQPAGGAPAAPRLSLLLAEPRARSLQALADTRAILATEIYEYALSLSAEYVMPELQVYKFVMACRLVDCGQYERALAYVEQAARAATRAPRDYAPRLVRALADMADRLKYHDPALHEDPPLLEEGEEGSPRHQQWLHDVQGVAHMVQAEAEAQLASPQPPADLYGPQPPQQQQYSWDQAHQYQQQQAAQPPPPAQPPQYAEPEETPAYEPQYYPPPGAGAADAAPEPDVPSPQYAYEDWNRTEEHHAQHYADSSYWQPDSTYGYGEASGGGEGGEGGAEDGARPVITMPGARAPPHNYGDEDDRPDAQQPADGDADTPKSSRKADSKTKEALGKGEGGKGGGWLGGILTKLSLRPPNQMILPDDKNPTIVWDADKKRWKNLDGEDAGGEQPPPPPPRTADLAPHLHQNTSTPNQSPAPAAGAPPPPVSNIFKMQKGRHIKKSYVDVFNPSGAATRPLPPAGAVLGPPPALAANPTYFVPPPAQTVHVSIPPSPSSTPPPAPVRKGDGFDPRAERLHSGI